LTKSPKGTSLADSMRFEPRWCRSVHGSFLSRWPDEKGTVQEVKKTYISPNDRNSPLNQIQLKLELKLACK